MRTFIFSTLISLLTTGISLAEPKNSKLKEIHYFTTLWILKRMTTSQ